MMTISHYILLSVVADFPTIEESRAFIDGFESRLRAVKVLSCDWRRYPKFEHAYWYNWFLCAEGDPGVARAGIRAALGPVWFPSDAADEAVWNRPESVSPEDQPESWAHLHGEDCLTEEHVRTLARGPEFVESSAPFISVSTQGRVTGVYGGEGTSSGV
jgi:hypothetical protein